MTDILDQADNWLRVIARANIFFLHAAYSGLACLKTWKKKKKLLIS